MGKELIQKRITKKEREFIEKFKDENNIQNDTQFLKLAIEDLLGVNIADATKPENSSLPLEYLTVYRFYEYLKKSSDIDSKTLEKLFKKWANEFWWLYTRKHNEKLAKADEMWEYFKTKRKVGRPAKYKRKRGRPKDTGLENK